MGNLQPEAGAISGILFAGYMMSVPVLTSLTDRMDSRRIYLVACLPVHWAPPFLRGSDRVSGLRRWPSS